MANSKPKVGIVGLCSEIEAGGERFDELIRSARDELGSAGLDVVAIDRPVRTALQAFGVCDELRASDIDLLVLMDITWVCDSLSYVFVQQLGLPVALWAVPYTETFSIACVQEFGQALKTHGIGYEYVYGMPTDIAVVEKLRKAAVAARIVKGVRNLRVGLAGPRQTWRVAGAQDMTAEEWQFSRTLGPTIAHLDMETITDAAAKIDDVVAAQTLEQLQSRTGKQLVAEKAAMLHAAKVYLATKSVIQENDLDIVAAQCYPLYSGLMNQPASWLGEEGYVIETEGDIGNAVVEYILSRASSGVVSLVEAGSYDVPGDFVSLVHEGSSPVSLAAALGEVKVSPSGDGTTVGFPMRPMSRATAADFQGVDGRYQMLVAPGEVLQASQDEWVDCGERMLVKFRFDNARAADAIDSMMEAGLHHHLVVAEGDVTAIVTMVCRYLGVKVVAI